MTPAEIRALADAAAEITRLCARVSELEAAQQWQPIETAPKDGTKVLVGRFGHDNELLWAKHSRWVSADDAAEDYGGQAEDYEAGWADGEDEDEICHPTHWVSFPAPPAAEQEANSAA